MTSFLPRFASLGLVATAAVFQAKLADVARGFDGSPVVGVETSQPLHGRWRRRGL